jgi:hypothetical protein
MVELLAKPPLSEYRTRLRNSRSCSLLLVCAIVVASSGCAQVQPSPSSDPIKRLDNIMDSSAYFFPRPQPSGGDAYGAAFVRRPSVIQGNELPAIQGAQSYGKRMLEGAAAAQDCAKSHDPGTATACKEFVTKFCDRAQGAFKLSQDETDWWRWNSPTFQNQATAAKSVHQPPKLIPQTRLVACGIDKIQVVQGYDVGGTSQIATSVAANKPKAKDAAPVAPGSTGAIAAAAPAPKEVKGVLVTAPPFEKAESATLLAANKPKAKDTAPVARGSTVTIAAAAPAPKEVKGVVATAPPFKKAESATLLAANKPKAKDAAPVAPGSTDAIAATTPAPKEVKGMVATAPPFKKAESTTLLELPPAPKQEDAYPSKVAPQAARAKAVTAPVQAPDAGTEAFRNARPKGSGVAAVSRDESIPDQSQTKPQDNKSTPTNAPISSVVTGTFGGQVFFSSGGHSSSAGLILTLEEAGKELKGAWIAEQGKSGILTGILAGSKIAVLRLKQLKPCAGSYDGSVVIVEDGSRLRGSYTGTDCKGQVDAAFTVAKR